MPGQVATAEVTINAPASRVWEALTDPDLIARYMFGARVQTDWQPGHPITWSGQYEGKPYQDKGTVLDVVAPTKLEVTHYSPLSGLPDIPDHYHHVAYHLAEAGDRTTVTLRQDGNDSAAAAAHSQQMWQAMLDGMKGVVEGRQ
ncbi:MAG: SRPBCC domain-containing protein [Actinomycetota bacterium]|nr:MAG: SRPBCC domain-containing protein [Actinomycetota bacterium]